jgi:hypothetical protein
MLWELYKSPEGEYFVAMTANDVQVNLPEDCKGDKYCQIDDFLAMLGKISFYGDYPSWYK